MEIEETRNVSVRLSPESLALMQKEAEKIHLSIGVYIRIYVESMLEKYGLLTVVEKKAS